MFPDMLDDHKIFVIFLTLLLLLLFWDIFFQFLFSGIGLKTIV